MSKRSQVSRTWARNVSFDTVMLNGKKLGDCSADELMRMGRLLISLATDLRVKTYEDVLDDPSLPEEHGDVLRRVLDRIKGTDDALRKAEVLRLYGKIEPD